MLPKVPWAVESALDEIRWAKGWLLGVLAKLPAWVPEEGGPATPPCQANIKQPTKEPQRLRFHSEPPTFHSRMLVTRQPHTLSLILPPKGEA